MYKRTSMAIAIGAVALVGAFSLTTDSAHAETSPFTPPAEVLAPTMTSNGPAQLWMYPNDPAKVAKQLMTWLSDATPVSVTLPKPLSGLHFEDYMGPTQVYFTDQARQQVTIAPVFYITRGRQGYHPTYVANDLTYKVGDHTQYIRSPGLFHWLTNDKQGPAAFRTESWTPAQQVAIRDVRSAKSGRAIASAFPALPGIETHALSKSFAALGPVGSPATFTTIVNQVGKNQKVMFVAVSANGTRDQHFTYTVNAHGAVVSP